MQYKGASVSTTRLVLDCFHLICFQKSQVTQIITNISISIYIYIHMCGVSHFFYAQLAILSLFHHAVALRLSRCHGRWHGLGTCMARPGAQPVDVCFFDGNKYIHYITGWWLQTFVIFHNTWDNPSHWLIFFKMVKTTNQITLHCIALYINYIAIHSRTYHYITSHRSSHYITYRHTDMKTYRDRHAFDIFEYVWTGMSLYVRIDGMMGMFQDGVMYPAMWALCHTH